MTVHNDTRDVARQEQAARELPCLLLNFSDARNLQRASLVGASGSPERAKAVNAAVRQAMRNTPHKFKPAALAAIK